MTWIFRPTLPLSARLHELINVTGYLDVSKL